MNGFASLPVQFLKIRQAHPANVELTQSRLANRETSDSQVIHAVPAAVQKACTFQIRQKTMNRAHRQPRPPRHLLRGESVRRLTEDLEQPQPALQGRDVVASLWSIGHVNSIESDNYKMKVRII